MKHYTLSFLLLMIVENSLNIKVKVKHGEILGTRQLTVFKEKLYYAFYGVPYAQPPVGKLRFKDPKPVKNWAHPLDATTEYHGACAQAHIVHKHGQYGFENCLYLNIYTPHLPTKEKCNLKAVVVWIHGYAFTSSFSHNQGADFLIENDLVVVSLTHRIGAFGFLKINESDSHANMGLKDIVKGLKWIQKNIDNFGGDKKNITVMGSGSAGTFISLLLATKYKKLFSKMILQSSSVFSPSIFQGDSIDEKNKLEKELMKLGIKEILKASSEEIIQASHKIYNSKDVINYQRPITPFSPVIEKMLNTSLLTETATDMYKIFTERTIKIPILIGFTSQESIPEAIPFIHNPQYLKSFQRYFKFRVPFYRGCKYNYTSKTYKIISDEIKNWYFKNGISENSLLDFLKYVTDLHKYPIYEFIQSQVALRNNQLFVYKFNYVGKFNMAKATSIANSNAKVKGAAEGDEICYIMKCEPYWESYVKTKQNSTDRDRIFIEQISEIWANFAKLGYPASSITNFSWPPFTLQSGNIFHFGKENKIISSRSELKMFKFWNDLYKKYYASDKNCPQSIKDEL